MPRSSPPATPPEPGTRPTALAVGALRRGWALRRPFLVLHLAATLLVTAVLAPLAALIGRLAIMLSGAPAVADKEIALLALSPLGLLGALILGAALLTAAVFEVAAMIALDASAGADPARGVSVRAALQRVASRLPAIGHLAAALILRLGLRAAPFLLAGLLAARMLLGEADINFYLTARPPEFLLAAGVGALLLLAMAAVLIERLLAWSLALPAVVLGGAGGREALGISARLTARRRAALLRGFGLWAAGALALGAAISAATGLVARALAPETADSVAGLDSVALHVLFSVAALSVGNVIATAAAAGWLASLLRGAHEALGGFELETRAAPASRALRPAAALALAALAGAGLGGLALSQGLRAGDAVEVIGHRGAAGARPENTLAAIEKAVEDGADWVEIDVQETADGAVVVIHDRDFMKLAGDPLRVSDATLEQIAQIDIGSWFDPAFADSRAPTLVEALGAVRGRAKLLIELKHYGRAVRLEERVAEIVEAAGMAGEIAVMSLDHGSAARMKALRPDWRVGLLAATAIGDLTRLEADFLAVGARLATPGLIRRARAAGREIYVWTVNDPVAMSRMISLGAAGLITDEPARARAVIAARAEMTTAERLALLAADLFGVGAAPGRMRDASP